MKIAVLSLLFFAIGHLAARADDSPLNDRVSVSARADIDTDLRNIKGSTAHAHTQKISLNISLTGRPKSRETRTLKWYIFGRDERSNSVTIIGSGDGRLALAGVGRQTIQTKVATTNYTPDHSVVERKTVKKRGGGKEQRTTVRRVKGSGSKYIGYGVVVKQGETVVGKVFLSPGLEAAAR